MKRRIAFFVLSLLSVIYFTGTLGSQVSTETGTPGSHSIPVYPGATLLIAKTGGEESSCCDFVTKDAFEKVIAFYEKALKTRVLDASSLTAKYPDMKAEINSMMSQIPPQLKIRFFVLQEIAYQGKKAAELFELTSDPSGVHFTISETQFITSDSHFAGDYKEAISGIVRPKALTDEQFAAALPTFIPAGYTKEEINYSKSDARQSTGALVSYRKLNKKGHGSGEDRVEDQYVNISVGISDESGNMEFT